MKILFYILLLTAFITSCSDKKEVFETESLTSYLPLTVGRSITYRLDSTVFEQSGSVQEVHSYQVKHTILQETTDNTGNKTYIVQRLINDVTASGPWVNNGTYMITVYNQKIEVINDNLRVIALQAPLKLGFTWYGNVQLPASPYKSLYDMDAGSEMNKWAFSYTNYSDETFQGQQYPDVWTIQQNNDSLNIPPTTGTSYGSKEVSIEKYAKGIGLVYKNFQLYEYQGGDQSTGYQPYYIGFGITMWMIERN